MLRDMSEDHEKSSSEAPIGSSSSEDNERDCSDVEDLTRLHFGIGSHPVDQDVHGALQSVAVIGQRSNLVPKLRARHRGQFLNPHDQRRPFKSDSGRETRKGHIPACLAQWRHDTRGVNADQIGLQSAFTIIVILFALAGAVAVTANAISRKEEELDAD